MQLALFESYCLPLLAFAAGAGSWLECMLEHRVFNFNRSGSVKSFINGLGKLSLQYILKIRNFIFINYTLLILCFRICLVALWWLFLQTTAYVVCLSGDMRLLMLCRISLKLIVYHSRLCCIFVFNVSAVFWRINVFIMSTMKHVNVMCNGRLSALFL